VNFPTFGSSPRWAALAVLIIALAPAAPAGAGGLQDELLENKYRWGDYAVYGGWHEPAGEQFHVHASAAYPFGAKVRLRWGNWMRVEADVSYYQRGGDPRPYDLANIPGFDGLTVAATLQATTASWKGVRPYAGGGPVFVSLTNEFGLIILGIPPDTAGRFQVGRWNENDVGVQAVAGLDIQINQRFFPFVEYRHLFGEVTTDVIRVGAFGYSPDEVTYDDGRPVPGSYDWSGPVWMLGLKIRF
jgi:opacity protein-like surface antigen